MAKESETNQQRWGASMWLSVIAVIVVVGAAFFGWYGKWERGIPSDAVKAGKVVADGTTYYGTETKIYGYVSTASTSTSGKFFLITDVAGTASLPVLVKGHDVEVALGEKVIVVGTPTAFDTGRIKQDYGINLPEESTRGWENHPVVIAKKVLKLD